MNRSEKILAHVSKDGVGLEIGPAHSPITPKRAGYNVDIVDVMDRNGLLDKYQNVRDDGHKIEEVDFVWKGQSYKELTGKSNHYDWMIASHVIEHTPDLIGFLNDCDSILKDDGVLSLAIPDKRFCFDYHRPITGIARVVDAHITGNTTHTPGSTAEFFLNTCFNGKRLSWEEGATRDLSFIYKAEKARNTFRSILEGGDAVDLHAWCFVPHSFRLLIEDLYQLGLTPFREVCFFETVGCEFYVTLGREGKGFTQDRLDALAEIRREEIMPELVNIK